MHIARYNISEDTKTEGSRHILFQTKLKLRGLEVLTVGQEDHHSRGLLRVGAEAIARWLSKTEGSLGIRTRIQPFDLAGM